MGKRMKLWLIIAVSLVVIGGIVFVGVMSVLQWDFMKLSTVKYETNSYEINEAYKKHPYLTTRYPSSQVIKQIREEYEEENARCVFLKAKILL